MSRLESRAKPVLIPLLTGRHVVLNKQNQEILATWIATRLQVAEFSDPESRDIVTPPIERSLLMGRRRPPDIMRIWIGNYVEGKLRNAYYRHSGHMRLALQQIPKVPRPSNSNIQAQTFLIGQLFVQGITTTIPDTRFGAPAHWRLFQLWPYQRDFVWPPPLPVTHDLTSDIATALDRTKTFEFLRRPASK